MYKLLLPDRSIDPSVLLSSPPPHPGNGNEMAVVDVLQRTLEGFIEDETEAMKGL